MICDGGDGSGLSTGTETFDTTKYSKLYSFLGTDKVPDLRECVLIGVGTNSTFTIASHDTYTVGEFKDDQLQNMTGKMTVMCSQYVGDKDYQDGVFKKDATYGNQSSSGSTYMAKMVSFNASRVARTGYNSSEILIGSDVTHGKQIGVNYLIKAL